MVFQYFMTMEERSRDPCRMSKDEYVIYERKVLSSEIQSSFTNIDVPIQHVQFSTDSQKIEDSVNTLKVNFANSMIGGGVLEGLTAQEEILFIEYPEQILSMLFCDRMRDHESIVIHGCEAFSVIKGYRFRLSFAGRPPHNNYNNEQIVAIDATEFNKLGTRKQFQGM